MTTDNSQFKTPEEIIRCVVRFFGWMLSLMGAFCVLIDLVPLAAGGERSLAGLVVGVGMLTAGAAMFRIARRLGSVLEKRLPGFRLIRQSARNEAFDGNRELDAGPSTSTGHGVGLETKCRKTVDAPDHPSDTHITQKAYRIGDRNRFFVSRHRRMRKAYYAIGFIFIIIAFFYSNGTNAIMDDRLLEIDFISFIMVMVGLAYLIVAGLSRYVEIDRGESWVRHGWKWFSFRFANRFPLLQFDHVLIRRLASCDSENAPIWQPIEEGWEVLLRGAESLNIIYSDNVTDARDLARELAGYAGLPVKEEI